MEMRTRRDILIVEDDPEMADVLRQGFENEDLTPILAADGQQGLELAREHDFRAIVLDVMLPGIDGFTVARTLRTEGSRTPILFLTARDSVSDIVYGLDCGAEDYVVKPFSFLELAARVRALIRRNQPDETCLRVGDLIVDAASRQVSRGGNPISLTRAPSVSSKPADGRNEPIPSRNDRLNTDATGGGRKTWPLRNRCAPWTGRHGRSVSRARPAA
jgi:DNA-binding response OmpR family regulator